MRAACNSALDGWMKDGWMAGETRVLNDYCPEATKGTQNQREEGEKKKEVKID